MLDFVIQRTNIEPPPPPNSVFQVAIPTARATILWLDAIVNDPFAIVCLDFCVIALRQSVAFNATEAFVLGHRRWLVSRALRKGASAGLRSQCPHSLIRQSTLEHISRRPSLANTVTGSEMSLSEVGLRPVQHKYNSA